MKGWRDLKRLLQHLRSRRSKVLVGLDFDGTLSPLVRRPAMARLPGRTRRLLARLARNPSVRLAIISGRGLADIMSRIRLRGVHYSGNHGLEIRGPRVIWRHPKALAASGDIRNLARGLAPELKHFPGTMLEDKGLTLSVHYRGMDSRTGPALHEMLDRSLKPYAGNLVMASGKKTWEIRPKVGWNKGHALLKIAYPGVNGGGLFFVGDDRTDEEGFRVLGRRAVTVRVGPAKKSAARFVINRRKDVDSLLELLDRALP